VGGAMSLVEKCEACWKAKEEFIYEAVPRGRDPTGNGIVRLFGYAGSRAVKYSSQHGRWGDTMGVGRCACQVFARKPDAGPARVLPLHNSEVMCGG
jgi:hypothetical protein